MSKKHQLPTLADEGKYKTLDYQDAGLHLPETINGKDERFLITDRYLRYIVSRIEGSILTIIESSSEDKEKREATKSLARRLIWNEASDIRLLALEKIE